MRVGGGGTGGGCVHSDGAYWFLQDQWKIYVRIITVSIVNGVIRVFALCFTKFTVLMQKTNKKLLKNFLDSPQILPDTSEGSW
jgi:hypothetical protein